MLYKRGLCRFSGIGKVLHASCYLMFFNLFWLDKDITGRLYASLRKHFHTISRNPSSFSEERMNGGSQVRGGRKSSEN